MPIWRISNPLQNYAWGDTEYIPRLLGQAPKPGEPVAEMWLGAHPKAPSQLQMDDLQIPLDQFIAGNPAAILGNSQDVYSHKLPFLFKVLAAAEPLSIQAHPSLEQARHGFERENDLRIPLSAPNRNYRDDNHKPELICALTPFQALCGFRDYPELIQNFRDLGLGGLFPTFTNLERFADTRSFQKFFLQIMAMESNQKREAVQALLSALHQDTPIPTEISQACLYLHKYHPYDVGVFAPLFLNLVILQPGEALYLGSGILHAYLKGAGIEVMANSDNVLRGGLTAKHIDLVELTRVLHFTPYPLQRVEPQQTGPQIRHYPSPAKEFELSRVELGGEALAADTHNMPLILLCDDGAGVLKADSNELLLQRGDSAFVSADTGAYTLSGQGSFWLASVPA